MELTDLSSLLDGLRILLLEDELLIAMDVEQLCLDHGASEVTIVRSLGDLDQAGIAGRYDAAIVDLMLGGVSTLDFAQRLKDCDVPFVFATGYSETDEIRSTFPGVALVEKPYAGADLVEAVAASFRRPTPQLVDMPIT
jgi:DNA-binding response OmpR family regulator